MVSLSRRIGGRFLQTHWMFIGSFRKGEGLRVVASVCALLLLQTGPLFAQRIAFASDRNGGRFQIWRTSLTNPSTLSQVTMMGAASQQSRYPSWSSTAGAIAFQFGASPVEGINLITPVRGGTAPRLTTSSRPYPCTSEDYPSWSMDGTSIAYTCTYSGNSEIWIHSVSANADSKLAGVAGVLYLKPKWSPDGTQVAFVAAGPGSKAEIMVANVSSKALKPLTTGGFTNFDPSWSPDGTQIAFSSIRPATGPGRHIFRMSTQCPEAMSNCPAPAQLTTENANDTEPAWAPNGGMIAFSSDRSGKQQLYVMDPLTVETLHAPTLLSDGTANDQDPAWEQVPLLTMVDPVPDLTADILSPSTSTSQTIANDLSTKGRPVKAIAADGVARVLIRIPATSSGQQFQITVQTVDNQTTAPSSSIDDDGGIAPVGSSSFQSTATVSSLPLPTGGFMAFAQYLAPVDFHRLNNPADDLKISRAVSLSIMPLAGGASNIFPITIVRPPLFLIHGTFSNPAVFDDMKPLFSLVGSPIPMFFVRALDYSDDIDAEVVSTVPDYSSVRMNAHVSRNVVGVAFNSPFVFSAMLKQIANFKESIVDGYPYFPIAAVQGDIVAHSLGGLIARGMSHVGSADALGQRMAPTTPRGQSFYDTNSYGKGYIHKLITLGTPHLGTNLPLRTLDGNNDCVRDLSAHHGEYSLQSIAVSPLYPGGGTSYAGAAADQSGDPTTGALSPTLQILNQPRAMSIPTALIAAQFDASNDSNVLLLYGNVVYAACGTYVTPGDGDFLATHYSFRFWPFIFGSVQNSTAPSDVIVPLASATLGGKPNAYILNGVVHGPGTVGPGTVGHGRVFDPHIGFAGPQLLDPAGRAPGIVFQLLETNVKDTSHFVGIP